jgi:hypothetical protein
VQVSIVVAVSLLQFVADIDHSASMSAMQYSGVHPVLVVVAVAAVSINQQQ